VGIFEDVLHAHPATLGASVIGAPDSHWREVPVAFVQTAPKARPSAEELEVFCRERLASYKSRAFGASSTISRKR